MNRLVLTAAIVERSAMRYTPAGLAALDLRLAHESMAAEAGHQRQVRMELRSVVIGPMAEQLNRVELGVARDFAGFLASQRNGRGVVFHITELP
ncbi:primosomal replication protein N [Schlegelella sp. S2-27]|uniref:Replication restart protein PriB n=1 Tax=Caldimonas mangrovi TaxID=2944811 RepID=A0ABT0YRZ3_9BURK|nr:primosomal replication protein N [Caldimonas mangrovi]MCM5681047.1 primosomal replication protein N [Caldimonas mangrovi]